ncbi:hypothetical protein D1872_305000 [compost metagenome]
MNCKYFCSRSFFFFLYFRICDAAPVKDTIRVITVMAMDSIMYMDWDVSASSSVMTSITAGGASRANQEISGFS